MSDAISRLESRPRRVPAGMAKRRSLTGPARRAVLGVLGTLVAGISCRARDDHAVEAFDEARATAAVSAVLDALHHNASVAHEEAYFGLFAPEGVFFGTDASHRTVPVAISGEAEGRQDTVRLATEDAMNWFAIDGRLGAGGRGEGGQRGITTRVPPPRLVVARAVTLTD